MADEHTFLFADLCGFTALTEQHGDEEAADIADGFSRAAEDLLRRHGATQVKAIGDALMVHCPQASDAVGVGLGIVYEIGGRPGMPNVRVGMHTDTAVERDGDWYGTAVNLAARVAGVAAGGQVLLTERTLNAAGELPETQFVERGRQTLKNVPEPVSLYEALGQLTSTANELPIDPVCRMAVDPERAAGSLQYEATRFHFCSIECARAFTQEPQRYPAPERGTS